MSTHIKIISENERKEFDLPPHFSYEERQKYFTLPAWAETLLLSLRTDCNKIGFVLQYGYFTATNRFYLSKNFHKKDIEYIKAKLKIMNLSFRDLDNYKDRTFLRHQELILINIGFAKFDDRAKELIENEAFNLCRNHLKPRLILFTLVDFLKNKRIEIPTFYLLSEVITKALKSYEKTLIDSVEKSISNDERELLDNLLEINEEYFAEEKSNLKLKRYKLTLLKKSNHELKPSKIKENVDDLKIIYALYKELLPIIEGINLSMDTIRYYAQVVIRSQVFQIDRRNDDKKYLLLISFVIHHFFRLNDLLVDIIFKSTQTAINTSNRDYKEILYENRISQNQKIKSLVNAYKIDHQLVSKISEIVEDTQIKNDEKISLILSIISERNNNLEDQILDSLSYLDKDSKKALKDSGFYNILEQKSVKLQNRVSNIIKEIVFDPASSNKAIMCAIDYFKEKDGKILNDAPIDFLEIEEENQLYSEEGKFRISLYKALFFDKIAQSIKSGSLNLLYSYQYKNFDCYLIPKDDWEQNKNSLLEKAGIREFENFNSVSEKYRKILTNQFRITNRKVENGENEYIKFKEKGNFSVSTPKIEKDFIDNISDLFPQNRFIPLYEILATVNDYSNFIDDLFQ